MDQSDSIITGVSVLSVGEARGHGEFVDQTTLQQFIDCAREYQDGIKVKADHGGGVMTIVGRLKNFRIDGSQLRADLHLLKNARDRELIREMATEMPEDFGMSPTFLGEAELVEGQYRTRCDEILSIDLVDMPASNPTGLFARKLDNQGNDMDNEEIIKTVADAVAEAVAPIAEKIEEMQSAFAEHKDEYKAMAEKLAADEEPEEMSDEEKAALEAELEQQAEEDRKEMQAIIEQAVDAKLKEFAAKIGVAKPASAQVADDSKPQEKTFTAIVRELVDKGNMTKLEAIQKTIRSNPTEYQAALKNGEMRSI